MSDGDFQERHRDPTEAELRAMLEARELEKDLERNQTSRKFTVILLVFVLAITGTIYFFPGKPADTATSPAAKPVTRAPLPTPYNPDPTNSDPGLARDLKPFTPEPGMGNQTEDIRFAMQLMNFMDAPNLKRTLPIKEQQEAAKKP